jgi:hypothetical protein
MKMRNFGKFTMRFGNFTMKKTNFRKFTILWEYFHGNWYSGEISMDICNYALRCGEAGKN